MIPKRLGVCYHVCVNGAHKTSVCVAPEHANILKVNEETILVVSPGPHRESIWKKVVTLKGLAQKSTSQSITDDIQIQRRELNRPIN